MAKSDIGQLARRGFVIGAIIGPIAHYAENPISGNIPEEVGAFIGSIIGGAIFIMFIFVAVGAIKNQFAR